MNYLLKRCIIFVMFVSLFYLHAGDQCVPCNTEPGCFQVGPCCSGDDACISNKGGTNDGSHSFFRPREITPNNVFQHNLTLYWWYHDVLCERDCIWWTLQISPFYQRSQHGSKVAEYFFPCNLSEISIKQDGTGNVGSLWLNLIAADGESYDSSLSMRPQRSVVGAYFNVRFDISRLFCHGWLDIAFAVMRVKHELQLCENVENGPGVACDIENASDALNQTDWRYGTFEPCALTRRGVDDVQIRFGFDWFYCEMNHLSPYLVGTVPTGQASSATQIFEPMVGSNHGSIGLGMLGACTLWVCDDREFSILSDLKYRYVLRACEKRSFDLCANGDWSRYLRLVKETDPAASFAGINALTYDVQVTPRSTVDWWTAFHYQSCQWNLEFGYDFWWRARERVQLCSFAQNIGIYDLAGGCNGDPVSASKARICQSVPGENMPPSDETFVTLNCQDVNLNSGATPRAISNTLYLSLGYDGCLGDSPSLIGIGGSYEWGTNALDNWAVWAKFAMAY